MNKREIKNITDKYYRKLKKQCKTVTEGFDAEAIHQLRVAYKKLRAFLRMLRQGEDAGGEIKNLKKLKKGYRVSGSIRNLQLQQQRITEAAKPEPKKPQAYLTLLEKEIDKLKPELVEIFWDDPVAESKKKTDAAVPGEFSNLQFSSFIKKKEANVAAIIASGYFSDDNIHLIRKNLKDIFYNIKTYQEIEDHISSLKIWNGKDEKYFDQLLNELGSFQDKCTAIALLKPHWLSSLDNYNRKITEQIKKIWIKEKRNQKRLLVKKLKTDFPNSR
jgi:CHAD domain-containing protein